MRSGVGELDFLSSAALALGEFSPDGDVFQFVAERLGALLQPDTAVVAASYDPSAHVARIRARSAPDEMLAAARDALGTDPLGLVFPFDERARQSLSGGELHRASEGLDLFTSQAWPAAFARALEARLGVRSVHAQAFARKGDFLGIVALLSRAPALEHRRLIETFVRLAAVALQRQRVEARLRESEGRFRRLAEGSQDVLFRLRLRPTPVVEYASPATVRLNGHTPDEIYADPHLGAPCLYPEAWLSGGALRELPDAPVVASCRHQDGTPLCAEQNFTAIRDATGQIVAVEGIARDITKRREAEEALIDADRRKTEFIAVLSHELRNPLGAIQNGLYILERAEPGEEQARRARAVIERQLEHLTRLVDDLLDVTRISRGKVRLQREPVELNELVGGAAEGLRAPFARRRVDLEVVAGPAPVVVQGDRTRLRQVVDNLLQNAAKFTPPGGRASVSVREDAARAVLRVHNTGAPIGPELRARLFEPFVQADRTLDRSQGGLGLGLALVRGLVEMHGGSVDVGSDAEGTTFEVRLPLDATLPGDAPRPGSTSAAVEPGPYAW